MISDVMKFPDEELPDKRFLNIGAPTSLGVINIR